MASPTETECKLYDDLAGHVEHPDERLPLPLSNPGMAARKRAIRDGRFIPAHVAVEQGLLEPEPVAEEPTAEAELVSVVSALILARDAAAAAAEPLVAAAGVEGATEEVKAQADAAVVVAQQADDALALAQAELAELRAAAE